MVGVRVNGLSSAKRLYQTILYQSSRTIASNILIQEPVSRIKTNLDSEMVGKSGIENLDLSWDSLLTSIYSSSPHKAQLVLEWGLQKLQKENEKNHDIYLELIHLCGKIQNTQTAMRVFTLMENQGLKPTSIILNALISAHLSSGNVITALSIFQLMQNSEDYKQPTSHTYNLFISGFANMGNSKAMVAWYEAKMASGFSADLDTYETIILGCIKLKRFEDADRFYRDMLVAEFKPNTSILHNMLVGLCERKDLVKIRGFMQSILDHKWEINMCMADKLVGFYCELELVKELEWVVEKIRNTNLDFDVVSQFHNGLIRVYAKLDRLDDLEYCIGRMLKEGVSFRSHKDVEMVVCCYFRGDAYDRLEVFLEFIKDSHKLARSTYELLVAGYRRGGLYEKVDFLIKDLDNVC
ncbi:pentatricopeptide repeat-containing protein At2g48000 [Lactuca sativa]|uniref:Pentatricopeptide repeat-containing protein-mitochondrial domain-containing protein n=1 Tax=Lactuca sativa TaxID=4236 RepID=A0A9R1V7V3_LACSA|nr:pentatricopeptide repeat-containing protein At2g48000 [Lactuca sativa]KAJ0200983.1 hypothetical protein LSAT_V11C600303510 [Lactuca sativa]